MENLSEPNATELFLKEKNDLGKEIRISCQTLLYGDVLIDAGYW
jgi:ferredoxin